MTTIDETLENTSSTKPSFFAKKANSFAHKLGITAMVAWLIPGLLLGVLSLWASFTQDASSIANRRDGVFWLSAGLPTLLFASLWVWKRSLFFWLLSFAAVVVATYLGMNRWEAVGGM